MTPNQRLWLKIAAVFTGYWLAVLALAYGAPIQLSHGHSFSDVWLQNTVPTISADGQFAVYVQDAEVDNAFSLWSVRMDGTALPVRLSGALVAGQAVAFQLSATGRAVYMVDGTTRSQYEVYSVPVGGGTSARLNSVLGADRDVKSFQITPDGQRVVYTSNERDFEKIELFSVPVAGGAVTRISAALPFDSDVRDYRISPNSATVVYRVVNDAVGLADLFSVPTLGGAAYQLNRTPGNGRVGERWEIAADSASVTYSLLPPPLRWFRVSMRGVPAAASALPVPPPPPNSLKSPDGVWTVYGQTAGGVDELWSVPVGGLPRKVSGSMVAGGDVTLTRLGYPAYSISPDSRTVLFAADAVIDNQTELFAAPIAGAGTLIFVSGFEDGAYSGWSLVVN